MIEVWIKPVARTPLTGDERFVGLDATVRDFWAFAMSDLLMNNVRGYLAEFLAARAVGATAMRVEWDAYDVLTPEGIRVEVKSAGLLQAWAQRTLSRISFGTMKGRTWTPEDGESPEATYNADVYVFAIETATRHEDYAPLDVSQWEFYVVPRAAIEATGYKSLGLPTLGRSPTDRLNTRSSRRRSGTRAAPRSTPPPSHERLQFVKGGVAASDGRLIGTLRQPRGTPASARAPWRSS